MNRVVDVPCRNGENCNNGNRKKRLDRYFKGRDAIAEPFAEWDWRRTHRTFLLRDEVVFRDDSRTGERCAPKVRGPAGGWCRRFRGGGAGNAGRTFLGPSLLFLAEDLLGEHLCLFDHVSEGDCPAMGRIELQNLAHVLGGLVVLLLLVIRVSGPHHVGDTLSLYLTLRPFRRGITDGRLRQHTLLRGRRFLFLKHLKFLLEHRQFRVIGICLAQFEEQLGGLFLFPPLNGAEEPLPKDKNLLLGGCFVGCNLGGCGGNGEG